jgi:hypothetical protein
MSALSFCKEKEGQVKSAPKVNRNEVGTGVAGADLGVRREAQVVSPNFAQVSQLASAVWPICIAQRANSEQPSS